MHDKRPASAGFARRLAVSSLILTLTIGALATDAWAGRRPFIWVWDTEVLHEREVELEQWIWEKRSEDRDSMWLWWAPIFGLSDTLELAIPLEGSSWWARKPAAVAGGQEIRVTGTQIEAYGLSLRWRLAPNDPEESGPLVPLLRFAVKRTVGHKLTWQVEANAVLSYDIEKLHTTLDVGVLWRTSSVAVGWLSYAWGVAWGAQDGLRVGGEVFGEVALVDGGKTFTMVGPDIGWSHGRSWFSLGVLAGVSGPAPDLMPRLIWAFKL